MPTPRGRRYAAITDPQLLGQLLRDMRAYSGNFISVAALRLAPLVFQRPGQLRLAHWEDVDLKKGLWRCPPENMKMREWQKRDSRTPAHIVPLSRQARFLAQRKEMVQQWADFLDALEADKMPKLAENVLWLKQA